MVLAGLGVNPRRCCRPPALTAVRGPNTLLAMPHRIAHPLPPVIIGVAGGSGSGKTTVAERVREAAPGRTVAILHHDSYYRDNSHLSPEQRALIHNDLWLDASNLLVQNGRVTGVIDWSNALYGDPLYEVARILWGTNWPGWWGEADVALVRDRFSVASDFDVRMACYSCHIGLDDLRYYAKNGRRADYEVAEGLLLRLVGARSGPV